MNNKMKNLKHILLSFILIMLGIFISCGGVNERDRSKDYFGDDAGSQSSNPTNPDAKGVSPSIKSVESLGNRKIKIVFSEAPTKESAENTSNYIINGLSISKSIVDSEDSKIVYLTTASQSPVSYTLLVLNIEDSDGNKIREGGLYNDFDGLAPADVSLNWKNVNATSTSIIEPSTDPAYTQSKIYIELSGTDIVAYKYKIDSDDWSAETDISTALSLSALTDGTHTLSVIGKHNLEYWQDTESATTNTWLQDTLAPTASFFATSLPSNPTNSQSISIQVIGTDVNAYYYCMDADCDLDNWTGPVSRSGNIIASSLAAGSHTLKARGVDIPGNTQDSSDAASYTWTIKTGVAVSELDATSLPALFGNSTSFSIDVKNTNGISKYKAKVLSGTSCGTNWADAATEYSLSTSIDNSFPDINSGNLDGGATQRQYTVCVVGKNSFDEWQGDSDLDGSSYPDSEAGQTKYTWTVDTAEPANTSLNWLNPVSAPSGTTTQTNYEIEIFGTDVAAYKYALLPTDGTSCTLATYSSEVSDLNTHILLNSLSGSPETNYTLCAIARDTAGNWQDSSVASSQSWTIDLVAPASNPSFSVPSPFTSLAINFSWTGETTDTKGYQIQIATSSTFGVNDITVDQEIGDVNTFAYAANPADGASYYARLKAIDSTGNKIASWSSISQEHYIIGSISGKVIDQTGAAVNGVTVELLDNSDADLGSTYADITTDVSGIFTFSNIRIANTYYGVRIADGNATYNAAVKRSISSVEGETTNTGSIAIVEKSGSSAQTINGKVVDADDGYMLGYALVSLIKSDGSTQASMRSNSNDCNAPAIVDTNPADGIPDNIPKTKFDDTSNPQGQCGDFSFASVPAGTYSIRISGTSWVNGNTIFNTSDLENVTVYDTTVEKGRIPLVKELIGQELKILLQWGDAHPVDLDLHVVGSLPSGNALSGADATLNGDSCDNSLFHAWAARPNIGSASWQQQFSAKNNSYPQGDASYNSDNFFPKSVYTTTALVQDNNTGYGPEAINFYSGYKDGTYWFTVINWSQWYNNIAFYGNPTKAEEQWDVTDVIIKVFDSSGMVFQMTALPPVGEEQYELWNAFKMTVSGNGASARQFESVNTYQDWPDMNSSGEDENKCNLYNF